MWKVKSCTTLFLFSFLWNCALGQGIVHAPDTIKWPSPEVEQVYVHALDYLRLGNCKEAMIAGKQAVILAPGVWQAQKALGTAQYCAGEYKDASETFSTLVLKYSADADCFDLLASCFDALKQNKKAKKAVNDGLLRFPGSGLLYNRLGQLYNKENNREKATAAWMNGILINPEYCPNYLNASSMYLSSLNPALGLLLGEMYLNLSTDTSGFTYIKQSLFYGYKTLYGNFSAQDKSIGINSPQAAPTQHFDELVSVTFEQLYPVVSDGISTENLSMLRTRFLMDWIGKNDSSLSFSLFNYHDLLIKTGHFDIYNEWLFGAAESTAEFAAWNNFHDGDIPRFLRWKEQHKFKTIASDARLLRSAKDIEFSKKKKRNSPAN